MAGSPGRETGRLPLWLLAAMVVVGVALEALRLGGVDWPPLLPLVVLLSLALARRRRRTRGAGGE